VVYIGGMEGLKEDINLLSIQTCSETPVRGIWRSRLYVMENFMLYIGMYLE
jgi:hypothetical protein